MSFADYKDNLLTDKGFDNYKGTLQATDGLIRSSSEDFPLMQSRDIQATADGKRLDQVLEDFWQEIENIEPGVTPAPTENLDDEIAEQYSLVEQIRTALLDKINVVGISKIEKTSSDGLIDTYTIYFTDNTTETFTVTNGKSAYEYAREAGYTGTEAEFAEKLADTGIVGSWTFKDDPDLTTLPDGKNEISFVSNGKEYNALGRGNAGASFMGIYSMFYYTDISSQAAYANNPNGDYDISHGWIDEAFKTVTIIREPTDPYMVTWIKANAEKMGAQSKSDARLKTKSKRIVEAINELSDKIDAGGGTSENSLLNISVTTDYPTTMSAIITAIEEAGGDVAKANFITFTGYLSRFVAIKFQHYGGNTYKVECIDINNLTKIYNPENDNVIDITSTRIGDFLSYTVNSGGGLPEYTEENNGQFMSIVDGVATWIDLPVAEDIEITVAEEITFNE